MRIPIDQFDEVYQFLSDRFRAGDEYAVLGDQKTTLSSMPECFSSRSDSVNSILTGENPQLQHNIYRLSVLCDAMKNVLQGGQCVANFVSNIPETGALCIDMDPIYHLKYYPLLIADILQDVDWRHYKIKLPESLLNAIMLMRRLATIPGGQHIGRLLWDYHVPKGKYPVPNAIRNDDVRITAKGSPRLTIQNLIESSSRNIGGSHKGPRWTDR